MEKSLLVLGILSGLSFVTYGVLCVFSGHMKAEFERYELRGFRQWVGYLELLGGLGVLLGHYWKPLLVFSAGGLALLMLLGLGVRMRLKDDLLQMTPAAFLAVINLAIVWIGLL